MDEVYLDSPLKVAIRRLPALFLTLFIELIGGVIISKFHLVIKKYTLLVSFMPALSALSGKYLHTTNIYDIVFNFNTFKLIYEKNYPTF